MKLAGKTILITRSAQQAEDFVHLIEQYGGTATVFSTIEIVPPDSWEECDRAIGALHTYDGLIFTSTNGVEFFFWRLKERGARLQELRTRKILAVGEKTKEAVEEFGLKVTTMPEKFTSADLAKAVHRDDAFGKSFLFPRGNLSTNALPASLNSLGASVHPVIVYKTERPTPESLYLIQNMLLGGKINFMTFLSPSSFKNFASLFPPETLRDIQRNTKTAVIGPVTARAITDAGFEVDLVAHESTVESLTEAIIDFFNPQT